MFDLESVLKPSIHVISRTHNTVMNTQLYHRYANNYHVRISNAGYASMTFYRDHTTKYLSYSNDLQDSLTNQTYQWRNCKNRQNKSSLPLLEPLLLIPELTSSEHSKGNKNQPECGKIVKIATAYALSFLFLPALCFT